MSQSTPQDSTRSPSRSPTLSNLLNAPSQNLDEGLSNGSAIFQEERPRKRARSSTPQMNGGGPALIPLEPSYFGVAPHDDFTREVGNWLYGWCKDKQHVEIEAKIGILLDTSTPKQHGPQRLGFPVATEAIITDQNRCRFESNMTVKQHEAFNALLNMRVEDQASPSYRGARIKYNRTREVDYFHETPDKKKVRVTCTVSPDGKSLTPKPNGMIEKERIANMNIFNPKQGFDFRISVSSEKPIPAAPPNRPIAERYKDRISYSHQILQVDLTSVQARDPKSGQANSMQTFELEVEFKDVAELMREGAKAASAEELPNLYYEMVQVFLNTIRMLIKNAGDP